MIRRIRRWVQFAALLAFLYLFWVAASMTPLPGLASLFYRLDPLVGLTAMLAAAWAALAGVEPIQKRQPADLIRPPGVREASFDTLCIRCNKCVMVCLCVKNKGGVSG